MSNSTNENDNSKIWELSTEIIIRGIVGLTMAIFITCGTSINKNSKFEILLMKTTIVKTLITLGLTLFAVFIDNYIAIAVLFLLSFAFYWMVHGVNITSNDLNNNDKQVIEDLNIKGNVLFTPDDTDNTDDEKQNNNYFQNENTPLLNNTTSKGKQLIINGINDALSIISNHSGLSNLSKNIGNIINDSQSINSNNISSSPKQRSRTRTPLHSDNFKSFTSSRDSSISRHSHSPLIVNDGNNSIRELSSDTFHIPTFNRKSLISSSDALLNKKTRRNSTPRMQTHKSDDELNDIIYTDENVF